MNRGILIFLTLLILSCKHETHIKIGYYKPIRLNKLERIYHHLFQQVDHFGNAEIIINSDCSFLFTTCSDIKTGKWNLAQDFLIFNVETSHWPINRSDSLNLDRANYSYAKWLETSKMPIYCTMENDRLIAIASYYDGTKILYAFKYNALTQSPKLKNKK